MTSAYDKKYASTFNFIDDLDQQMPKSASQEEKAPADADNDVKVVDHEDEINRANKAAQEDREKLMAKLDVLRAKRVELSLGEASSHGGVAQTKEQQMKSLRDELKAKRKQQRKKETETNNDDEK